MTDKINNTLKVGDRVVILHKRRPTTTSTLQVGTISRLTKSMAEVLVDGLNPTIHTRSTIVKLF